MPKAVAEMEHGRQHTDDVQHEIERAARDMSIMCRAQFFMPNVAEIHLNRGWYTCQKTKTNVITPGNALRGKRPVASVAEAAGFEFDWYATYKPYTPWNSSGS